MGQLDEVSQSIGKLQATVEQHGIVHNQILVRLNEMQNALIKKIDEHDEKLEKLEADANKQKGVWLTIASFSGVATAIAVKVFEKVF